MEKAEVRNVDGKVGAMEDNEGTSWRRRGYKIRWEEGFSMMIGQK